MMWSGNLLRTLQPQLLCFVAQAHQIDDKLQCPDGQSVFSQRQSHHTDARLCRMYPTALHKDALEDALEDCGRSSVLTSEYLPSLKEANLNSLRGWQSNSRRFPTVFVPYPGMGLS